MEPQEIAKYEQIIAYLEGSLTEEQQKAFEAAIQTDPTLAREIVIQRNLLAGAALYGEETLRASLLQLESQLEAAGFFETDPDADETLLMGIEMYGEEQLKARISRTMVEADAPAAQPRSALRIMPVLRWAAAASFLLMAAVAIYLWTKPRSDAPDHLVKVDQTVDEPNAPENTSAVGDEESTAPPAEQSPKAKQPSGPATTANPNRYLALAQQQYDFDQSLLAGSTLRSGDAAVETIALDSAVALIRSRQYPAAASLLESLPANTVGGKYGPRLQMLRAHLHFINGAYDDARREFEDLAMSRRSVYSEEAEYVLLLCYLVGFDRYEREYLALSARILADPEHGYYEAVHQLEALRR